MSTAFYRPAGFIEQAKRSMSALCPSQVSINLTFAAENVLHPFLFNLFGFAIFTIRFSFPLFSFFIWLPVFDRAQNGAKKTRSDLFLSAFHFLCAPRPVCRLAATCRPILPRRAHHFLARTDKIIYCKSLRAFSQCF